MEIAKSVSLKINIGNFQSVDLFCSVKAEVPFEKNLSKFTAEEMVEITGKAAEQLHAFCVAEITKDRNTSLKYLASLVTAEAKEKLLNQDIT